MKSFSALVVGIAGINTVKVLFTYLYKHPLYGKRILRKKSYLCHSDGELPKIGDKVVIISCKPVSRMKRYKVINNFDI